MKPILSEAQAAAGWKIVKINGMWLKTFDLSQVDKIEFKK